MARDRVHRNLNKHLWSLREAGKTTVTWQDQVFLTDVEFRVGQKGRERARREKRRNVHAYAYGDAIAGLRRYEKYMKFLRRVQKIYGPGIMLSYSPFTDTASFMTTLHEPVTHCAVACFGFFGETAIYGIGESYDLDI